MRALRFAGVLTLTYMAWAQEPAPLAFEVASIKVTPPGSMGWSTSNVTSQFTVNGMSLRDYIKLAWELQDYALEAPKWLDAAKFDIVGKLPEGAPRTQAAAYRMMQALLVDQFQLTFHREKREVNGYALILGNSGLQLTKATGAGGSSGTGSGGVNRIWAKGAPLSHLADQFSRVLNDPVVAMIQDENHYDYDLKWDSGDRPPSPAGNEPVSAATPAQTLAGALEQAGLKLEKRKVPIDLLIVDKMEKTPREQ